MPEPRDQIVDRLTRSASEALVRLRVRSALNPVLLLAGIVSLPCIAAAPFISGLAQGVVLSLGALPVLVSAAGFLYFMVKDPDKLQSEEYQIQKRALDIIEEKGGTIPIATTSIEVIANPTLRRLSAGREGDE